MEATTWRPGLPGYFRVCLRPNEPRSLGGYYVGSAGADGRALVFAVPGLGAHGSEGEGAAGPVVIPSGSFGLLAVRSEHARAQPRTSSGALAELDGAALTALLRGYYGLEADLELSDTHAPEAAPQTAVVPATESR